MTTTFSPGDTVKRIVEPDVFGTKGGHKLSDMTGVVQRVTPLDKRKPGRAGAGGVRYYVRVLWSNGHEARVEDRWLQRVCRHCALPDNLHIVGFCMPGAES